MPAQSLTTDAFVLLKRPPADAFQTFIVFSLEHGNLTILQRLPKIPPRRAVASAKAVATVIALDLFDEASLGLESSNQGRTWFVKEVRLVSRPTDIGKSYEALQLASEFTALLARNPVHEDSRAPVAALLRAALATFATGVRPDVVFFKSLYCFARDEGYPVKQQWLAALPKDLRAEADRLLATPVASLEPAKEKNTKSEILRRRLSEYLRGHTEILFD